MKPLFLGFCLVAGLGLSANVLAGPAARSEAVRDRRAPTSGPETGDKRESPERRIRPPAPARTTVYRDNPYVSIGATRMDTRLDAAVQLPAGWTYGDAAARRGDPDPYHLVKFAGPVGGRQRQLLASHGLAVIAYYPYGTFVVRHEPGRPATALTDIEGVAWVGRFHPYFKVGRTLDGALAFAATSARAAIGEEWGLRFVVGLHEEIRRTAVEARIVAVPGVQALLPTRGPIRIRVDPARVTGALQSIAALPDVAFVERWHRPLVANDENAQTTQSGNCTAAGSEATNTAIFNRGITGWNARLAIADTCIDANEGWYYDDVQASMPAHEASAPWSSALPDWGQRKIVEYYDMYSGDTTLGCAGATGCGICDHGTHVSSSAAGNCSFDPEGVATATDPANRDGDSDGMAPGARIIAQDLGNGSLSYLSADGGDLGELVHVAYVNTCEAADCGVDAHNNSWNAATNAYETQARTGDRELWDLKDLVVIVSAGNIGQTGFDTVRSPATGKNVIGVGSALACTAEDMASTSSRGDASDGRLKPDIVVGGDSVESAENDGDGDTNANGGCQTTSISGTSMAAGTMTGLAGLTLQYYNDGFYPGGAKNLPDALDPSGMLVKATLINAAQRMTGTGAEQAGVSWPNMDQGWGYVVLDNALHFAGESRKLWLHDEPVGVDVSGTSSMSFQRSVTSDLEPLKVTLVWYDKEHPGSCGSGTPCLLNDLDLTVTDDSDGTTYSVTFEPGTPGHLVPRTVVPSNPLAGQTATDAGPDDLNTVEQIILHSPRAANYTFTVTAANTPDGPIPFALVATGALDVPCPAPSSPSNNTATDVEECADTGVLVGWDQDLAAWNDGGSGSRTYGVLRDGAPIASGGCGGELPYGTTSCVDDTGLDNASVAYTVRYRSACGATVTTAGVVAKDQTAPAVDVTPDGSSDVCPGTNVNFSLAVDPPVGSYTYQWLEDGQEIPGETASTLAIAKGSVQTRHYNCRVTDTATACVGEDTAASVAQWTTDFSEVDFDDAFDPVPTLAESCGDGDAIVEPGEVWQVTTRLENTALCGVADNARADLALNAGSAVSATVCGATGYYGAIPAGTTATQVHTFDVDEAAVCGQDSTFDVTNIWWGGGAAGDRLPAFNFQVGEPVGGQNETANQFTDPLDVSSGSGFSVLVPSLSFETAAQAQLDYALSCMAGPPQGIYSSGFTSLSGWTQSGNVSIDGASSDTCPGSGGDNAYFDGNATITRTVDTTNFAGIHIEANFRGGGSYSGAGECFKWWYSVNGGSNWILYKDICGVDIPNGSWTCIESFDFPATADDNSGFGIRFETTGGVDIRLDGLIVEGGAPPCQTTPDVEVELAGPGSGVWTIKAFGAPDPPKPIDVTSFYNDNGGGPGIWRISVDESSGGTARITTTSLSITDTPSTGCNVSTSCECPAGAPGEVSDDPDHLLRLGKNGAAVDLRFEDLNAASYNVYVSTEAATSPFTVTSGTGKKDCAVATASAPGGMRTVLGYDVEAGILAVADVHFVLVTADNGSPNEGVAGYTSSSVPRSIDSPCAD